MGNQMKTFIIHDKDLENTYAVIASSKDDAISKYEKFWHMDDNDTPEVKEEWLGTLIVECIDHDCKEVRRVF